MGFVVGSSESGASEAGASVSVFITPGSAVGLSVSTGLSGVQPANANSIAAARTIQAKRKRGLVFIIILLHFFKHGQHSLCGMSLLNFTRHSSVKAYSFEKGRAVNAQPCFPHSLSCKSCVPCYRPLCILRLTYENAHVNAFGKHLTICSHLSRILSNPSAQAMTISLSPLHAGSRASGLSALTETAATRKRLAISKNVSPSQAL